MKNIHPLIVHFPIALFIASFIFRGLSQFIKRESLDSAARWSLWFGTLMAIVSLVTGLLAAKQAEHSGAVHEIMELHEKLAWIVTGLGVLLCLGGFFADKITRGIFGKGVIFVLQATQVVLLCWAGHLGGRMVYEFGVGTSIAQLEKADAVIGKDIAVKRRDSHQHTH